MQPIHLVIGLIEGIATAAILCFVLQSNSTLLDGMADQSPSTGASRRKVIIVLLAAAVVMGGAVSQLASANPDGLEWSMQGVAGTTELEADGTVHQIASKIQEATAFFPDYSFKNSSESNAASGTSVSGMVGGTITLGLACLTGFLITHYKKKLKSDSE